jgi:L-aminopeptidase/D-esterase-like protein
MASRVVVVLSCALTVLAARPEMQQPPPSAALAPTGGRGLTEVHGIKVGHHTLSERPTGCTAILVDGEGAVGGVSQRGGAPGTRETDLLDPSNMVDKVNAVSLSGGSMYGLDAARRCDALSRGMESGGFRVALMADDGFANAIVPSHTTGDGDTVLRLPPAGGMVRRTSQSSARLLLQPWRKRPCVRSPCPRRHGVPSARELATVPPRVK